MVDALRAVIVWAPGSQLMDDINGNILHLVFGF
jgi:hypothetical protein